MKNYTNILKTLAIATLTLVMGVTIGQSIPLGAQLTSDFQPCLQTPCFDGNIHEGTDVPIDVPHDLTVTELVLRVIQFVLDVILVIAVLAIIIAGVYLITGLGSDSSKERAKTIILYVVIGILVILFSRAIVMFFMGLFV